MSFLKPNSTELAFIPLTFSPGDTNVSAIHLVLTLFPDWKPTELEFVRFTDGITNTLLKCVRTTQIRNPITGEERPHVDETESLLIRAYGKGTNVLIDRERECQSHHYLSRHCLAPPLLARFNNGLIYRFIPGRITSVEDLSKKPIFTAVAHRLGQWHRTINVENVYSAANATGPRRRISPSSGVPELVDSDDEEPAQESHPIYGGGAGETGLWMLMRKWIVALPERTPEQKARKTQLEEELRWLAAESGLKGLGEVVYAHCDLLHGNVIVLPKEKIEMVSAMISPATCAEKDEVQVTFIDYEYATPAEKSFDLANHFAEWGGFDCIYAYIPTVSQRRDFIQAYLESYNATRGQAANVSVADIDKLMSEVDQYRGLPGFFWGIWALIQAVISQIDFDYAAYAEIRLSEYWTWKKSLTEDIPFSDMTEREQRWASA